jgi:nitrate reductase cytochrome c-type subunit
MAGSTTSPGNVSPPGEKQDRNLFSILSTKLKEINHTLPTSKNHPIITHEIKGYMLTKQAKCVERRDNALEEANGNTPTSPVSASLV